MGISVISKANYYSSQYAEPETRPVLYNGREALAQRVESIVSKRKEQRDFILSQTDWKGRFMVVSDVLNVGYMGLQGAQYAVPTIAKIPMVFWSTFVCGVLAGGVNIINGLISLHEAWKDGCDSLLRIRLFMDGICQISIGAIMLLVSLSVKVAALGMVAAAFANPWILPVLFLIIALPALVELVKRQVQMRCSNDDFMTQSNLKELKNTLEIPATFKNVVRKAEIIDKMQSIESEWGIDSAIEAMQLWTHLLRNEREQARAAIDRLEVCNSKWRRSLNIRLAEQLLLVGGFGLSMMAMCPRVNSDRVNAANSFSMMGASALPIYPDAAWPTSRSTPIVVPA